VNKESVNQQIRAILDSSDDQVPKAERIAEVIRLASHYRWVGIYEVDDREIVNIARSGAGAPTYPRFPVTRGLSGHAVASRSTVISNDVANDPRYLTAFESTRSEIIVPIISPTDGSVIGTIDVESERKNAFSEEARMALEECAHAVARLWR
jgi:GAF domain-containing protein